MVLKGLAAELEKMDDVFVVETLFSKFQRKHPYANKYTFFALLEIFCRHGISLTEMIDSINNEISNKVGE